MRGNLSVRRKSLAWAAMLLLSVVLVAGMMWYSRCYMKFHGLPQGENGVVDLAQIDFSVTPYFPLTEGWLFYPEIFLVSDFSTELPQKQQVQIPESWNGYRKGSYVLQADHFPSDWNLCIYIPNQLTQYRIYWNHYMVTTNQIKGANGAFSSAPTQLNRLPLPYNYQGNIVIEVEGQPYCAINAVPVLTTAENYNKSVSINNTIVGLSYGAVLFCLILYGALCTAGKTFQSYPLLLLLLLCLAYCFVRNAADNVVGYLIPTTHSTVLTRLVLLILFSVGPLLLAYNAQQIGLRPQKIEIVAVSLLCLLGMGLFSIGILFPLTTERLLIPCAVIWLMEVLVPLIYLKRCICAGCQYTLLLTSAEVCLLLGFSIDILASCGAFLFQATLWFPLLFIAMLLLLFFLYLQKIMYLQQQARKAQENEIAMVRLRLENQQSEAALMLSQMRPHFLCNALLSIYDVNLENHERANQAIIQFANYLRGNILSIGSKGPIPFEQELHHIENYVAIEKLRFEERLNMRYEIEYVDFFVPPLTVQPFVENAIKHGICKQISGGEVMLRTWAEGETVHILIRDNGVGFQVDQISGPESIGIKNVRTRLNTISGATLHIDSKPMIGTSIHITLPKGCASHE